MQGRGVRLLQPEPHCLQPAARTRMLASANSAACIDAGACLIRAGARVLGKRWALSLLCPFPSFAQLLRMPHHLP